MFQKSEVRPKAGIITGVNHTSKDSSVETERNATSRSTHIILFPYVAGDTLLRVNIMNRLFPSSLSSSLFSKPVCGEPFIPAKPRAPHALPHESPFSPLTSPFASSHTHSHAAAFDISPPIFSNGLLHQLPKTGMRAEKNKLYRQNDRTDRSDRTTKI
jgi:hypothetical protein